MNRAIIRIDGNQLLDLLRAAGAVTGYRIPAEARFISADYDWLTSSVQLMIEGDGYDRVPRGGIPMVVLDTLGGCRIESR